MFKGGRTVHHMYRFTTLSAGLATLALTAPASAATQPFFDVDFDDVAIPTPPGHVDVPTSTATAGETTTLPTNIRDADTVSLQVHPQFVDSVTGSTLGGNGDQVMIIDDPDSNEYAYVDFGLAGDDRPTGGQLVISFQLIADSSGNTGSNNQFYLQMLDETGGGLADFRFRQHDGIILGRDYDNQGNNSGPVSASDTFAVGEVVAVRIEVDLDQNRANLFLNGELVALDGVMTDGTYSLDLPDEAGFGALRILAPLNFTARLGVDDVQIAVPEPASLGLLSAGSLLVLSRRH